MAEGRVLQDIIFHLYEMSGADGAFVQVLYRGAYGICLGGQLGGYRLFMLEIDGLDTGRQEGVAFVGGKSWIT